MARIPKRLLPTLLALCLFQVVPTSLKAADTQTPRDARNSLVECAIQRSADGRLVRERWAAQHFCEEPLLTRVTDRHLGFTCTEQSDKRVGCRTFVPSMASREPNPARVVACVGVEMTLEGEELSFHRVSEWVGDDLPCDYSPPAATPAVEVDLTNGEICILPERFCTHVGRLTVIGRVRLLQRMTNAIKPFRNVHPGASSASLNREGVIRLGYIAP